jgi:signal peptidase I
METKEKPSLWEKIRRSTLFSLFLIFLLAIGFRSFVFEPFHIPSGSMKPNLLIGDYLFVTKFSYGYNRYSLPFHPKFLTFSLFRSTPKPGDVVVFIPPHNPDMFYVKRVIGLPGDKIEIKNQKIFVNNREYKLKENGKFNDFIEIEGKIELNKFIEENSIGAKYDVLYNDYSTGFIKNNNIIYNKSYIVPDGKLFCMGDNRDNSLDSRFGEIGFVPIENVIGKAGMIFLSINEKGEKYNTLTDKLTHLFRFERFFKFIN